MGECREDSLPAGESEGSPSEIPYKNPLPGQEGGEGDGRGWAVWRLEMARISKAAGPSHRSFPHSSGGFAPKVELSWASGCVCSSRAPTRLNLTLGGRPPSPL